MAESTTKTTAAGTTFVPKIDEGFKKFEQLGDSLFGLAKKSASQQVQTFADAVDNVLTVQVDLVKSTSLPWVDSVADTNASIVRSFTKSAADTAQVLLK